MASPSDYLPKVLILGGETRITFIAAERLARVGVVKTCVLKICASSQCILSMQHLKTELQHSFIFFTVTWSCWTISPSSYMMLVLRCGVCGTPFDNLLDKRKVGEQSSSCWQGPPSHRMAQRWAFCKSLLDRLPPNIALSRTVMSVVELCMNHLVSS